MLAAQSKAASVAPGDFLPAESPLSWRQLIEPVEPFLEAVNLQLAAQVDTFDPKIAPYADYALNGQGKHLRPALVALTANAFGKASQEHITVAVVIEMVHLATLVHDDVMDEAEIRRKRLTLAAHWGNDIAVLFGDCLFARALTLAASFPTPEVCRAVAMATNTVCSGEILQTQRSGDFRFTRDEYFKVLEMKTAELFALSCELSAFISRATPEQRATLREFGIAFGTAYQIYDDCVDLFGLESVAGKSLGTDLAKGKLTLPVLILWERAGAAERDRLRAMVEKWEPSAMQPMAALLARHGALSSSVEVMRQHLGRACQALKRLPESKGLAGLRALTDYLARQTDTLGGGPQSGL
jgi:octaprenyl-diphosphate synthase